MTQKTLQRFALLLAATTTVLIAAGGLVTSTGSGLSVPDWPLSYGGLFPPMIGGIRFEHSHRVIAGFVGILTLVLTILIWKFEKRQTVKNLALSTLLAVVLQAVLGGLTVIYLLPLPVSVFHACLGQIFLSLVVCLGFCLSAEWERGPFLETNEAASFRRLFFITFVFVFFQLVLGALLRHSGRGLRYHILFAFLIALHTYLIFGKVARHKEIGALFFRHAALLAFLVTAQIFLGFGSFYVTQVLPSAQIRSAERVLLTTAHQTVGALILAFYALLLVRVFCLVKMPKEEAGKKKTAGVKDFVSLAKPKLVFLALVTVAVSYFLAGGRAAPSLLGALMAGATLIGGGANALNQFLERDIDAKMSRTALRPLPAGRLSPRAALIFGLAIAVMGILVLSIFANPLSAFFGFLIVASYVAAYTPLKRRTPFNTLVGAVPGALPTLMGWAAASPLDIRALALFALVYVWQMPHFYAIAWTYREDYRRGGLRMAGIHDEEGQRTALRIFGYTLLLLPVSLAPAAARMAGERYFAAAFLLGSAFSFFSIWLFFENMRGARRFVSASVAYLAIIMIALMADKI